MLHLRFINSLKLPSPLPSTFFKKIKSYSTFHRDLYNKCTKELTLQNF
jgi:hypothetical protein